jgi:hypothetical protein
MRALEFLVTDSVVWLHANAVTAVEPGTTGAGTKTRYAVGISMVELTVRATPPSNFQNVEQKSTTIQV